LGFDQSYRKRRRFGILGHEVCKSFVYAERKGSKGKEGRKAGAVLGVVLRESPNPPQESGLDIEGRGSPPASSLCLVATQNVSF